MVTSTKPDVPVVPLSINDNIILLENMKEGFKRTIPDLYKTQEICGIVVSLYPFLIIYCPDKYITQRICDEAVDDSLAALKLIPDWLVTSKMKKKLYTALCTDNGLLFFDEDSGDVTFCYKEMDILSVNRNNNNLDNNFDEEDPDTLSLSGSWLDIVKLENGKHFKKR